MDTAPEIQAPLEHIPPMPRPFQNLSELARFYDSPLFQAEHTYHGNDLGLTIDHHGLHLRFWSPLSEKVELLLFPPHAPEGDPLVLPFEKAEGGTFTLALALAYLGWHYQYRTHFGTTEAVLVDPYAKAVGINGEKGVLLDLGDTDPPGFREAPDVSLSAPVDAVVYELHIRDLSIQEGSGIRHKGKYLGLSETGTRSREGLSTGLDHLKELGVTHVQLLPVFDFFSVDEARADGGYNWGYDPLNYNAPEGSYATDPADGATRIRELKTAIAALHAAGIGVIMDVVYNHTGHNQASNFHKAMPYYYHRTTDAGFSDASACGNETASERTMMRRFMVDSLVHWMTEYRLDGFRFDLMGIHDIETMRVIDTTLRRLRPDVLLYGEGWAGGPSPLPEEVRALKRNMRRLESVGAFNDDIRDAVKGHVFYPKEGGFVSGTPDMEESVKFGVVGACFHNAIDYSRILYARSPWALSPGQSVNYVEAHDNLTLFDKLQVVDPRAGEGLLKEQIRLSHAIVLTAQGMPFLHAGTEFLRTKHGEENSYKSPDSVNLLDWSLKARHQDIFQYVQGLIALRKAHSALRLRKEEDLPSIRFYDGGKDALLPLKAKGVVAYVIERPEETLLVAYNGSGKDVKLPLPQGVWGILVDKVRAGAAPFATVDRSHILLPKVSALVLQKSGPGTSRFRKKPRKKS